MLMMNTHLNGLVQMKCINVVQWLYSLGDVNIHADDKPAFRWCCKMVTLMLLNSYIHWSDVNIHTRNEPHI